MTISWHWVSSQAEHPLSRLQPIDRTTTPTPPTSRMEPSSSGDSQRLGRMALGRCVVDGWNQALAIKPARKHYRLIVPRSNCASPALHQSSTALQRRAIIAANQDNRSRTNTDSEPFGWTGAAGTSRKHARKSTRTAPATADAHFIGTAWRENSNNGNDQSALAASGSKAWGHQ